MHAGLRDSEVESAREIKQETQRERQTESRGDPYYYSLGQTSARGSRKNAEARLSRSP